ncbi:MAG: MCE family protein [Sedimentisphaerales bacterium]|nr:MCE family protein [Sedimentisphaerales bacterium]
MSNYERSQRRRDVIVGAFVIAGMAALAWLVFRFGDLPSAVSRVRSFQVYVRFAAAPGVQRDTPVRFCGFQIGRVTDVRPPSILEDLVTGQKYHQTECVLSINRQYRDIPANVDAMLMTRGLGSSYIELVVDTTKPPASMFLSEGVKLQGSAGTTSEFLPKETMEKVNRLVESINTFMGNANDIIGDPNNKQNVKATLANLTEASHNASVAITKATDALKDARETIEQYRQLASTGTETIKNIDAKAERLVASLVNTSAEIGQAMSQLRLTIEKINNGDGTAARLVNDARLYESLLETVSQLNVLLKDIKDLADKINEKGLRSIY